MSFSTFEENQLLLAFIKQKGLWKEYQDLKREEIRKNHETEIRFSMRNYKFNITLSKWQYEVFSEWAKALPDDWSWKYCERTFLGDGRYTDKYTNVLITAKDVKTIFVLFAEDKNKSYENSEIELSIKGYWRNGGPVIEELRNCSWYNDEESKCVGNDFADEAMNWAYKQKEYKADFSSIFNIEDK